MAESKIMNPKKAIEWIGPIINDDMSENDRDKTYTVSIPVNCKEIMFTMQRNSNGRTIASVSVPYMQFVGGAMYATGQWTITSGGNYLITGVCIYTDSSHIEIALSAISENVTVRVYYR